MAIALIDRVPITDATNVSKLLNNKVGEAVLLDVTHDLKDSKAKRRVEVTAIDRQRASKLMYERWVEAGYFTADAGSDRAQSGPLDGQTICPESPMQLFDIR